LLHGVGKRDRILQNLEELERSPAPCAAAIYTQQACCRRGWLDPDAEVYKRATQKAVVDMEEPWILIVPAGEDAYTCLARPVCARKAVLRPAPHAEKAGLL
jgi:hypothetical protein